MRLHLYHKKRTIIGPPAKRPKMAFRRRSDSGITLNAGLVAVIFRESRPLLLKKTFSFVIFFCPLHLDPRIDGLQYLNLNAFYIFITIAICHFISLCTVLPGKSDSYVVFCLHSYQGLIFDRSIVF